MKKLCMLIVLCSYQALCSMEREIRDSLLHNNTCVSVQLEENNEARSTEVLSTTSGTSNHSQHTCCGNTPQERCTNRFLLVNTVAAIALTTYLVHLMMQSSGSCNS